MFGVFVVGVLMVGGGYGYVCYLELYMIEIIKYMIKSFFIFYGFDGFKIVQFSDIYLSDYFMFDDFRIVILIINEFKFDLIVFIGDIIDNSGMY